MKKTIRSYQVIAIAAINLIYCTHIQALNDDAHQVAVNSARESLSNLYELGEYKRALHFAKKLVHLTKDRYGARAKETAVALTDLGVVHLKLDRYDLAKKYLVRSVSVIEDVEGEFSPLLVKALQHLGILKYRIGEFAAAMDYFRRAQHILHRYNGVYSLKQLGTLDWITRISMRMNQYVKADLQQKLYYKINEKHYGPQDIRMVPVLHKLGDWYRMTGRYNAAHQAYRAELNLMEQDGGDSQLKLIEPLNAIANMLYLHDACCPTDELERALSITRSDPAADLADKVAALVMLADMHVVKKDNSRARALYKEAWELTGDNNQVSKKDKQVFQEPILLGLSRTDEVVNAFRRSLNLGPADYAPSHEVSIFRPTWEPVKARVPGLDEATRSPDMWLGQLVGDPIPVCFPRVLKFMKSSNKKELDDYFIDLDFTVDDEGKVSDIEVTASNSPVKLVRYVKNLLRSFRYRPRMEFGEPTKTEHVTMHETFHTTAGLDDRSMKFGAGIHRAAVNHGCQLLATAEGS